ncbi:MAG TPA: hypothetical protein VLJ61_12580 [Pyrinomonadaceae bacterium]|nr:hypothetical protein [Pyrinomonadaceae bacterium]
MARGLSGSSVVWPVAGLPPAFGAFPPDFDCVFLSLMSKFSNRVESGSAWLTPTWGEGLLSLVLMLRLEGLLWLETVEPE